MESICLCFHLNEEENCIVEGSVKHSVVKTNEKEKILEKFSRHVFEQFLSICFIHLHVYLTNSEIKQLILIAMVNSSLLFNSSDVICVRIIVLNMLTFSA